MDKLTGKVWMLYNAATRQQTKPMPTDQMQKVLLLLKVKEINQYFIWSPGWEDWKALVPFLQSDQKYFTIATPLTSPNRRIKKDSFGTNPEEINKFKPPSKEETITKFLDDSNTTEVFLDENNTGVFYTKVNVEESTPTPKPDYGYYHNDFKAEDIDINAKVTLKPKEVKPKPSGAERRVDTRHDFKIEIILISKNGKTFRSHSKNISMGGTMLEDEIPKEFLNGEMELIIINKFQANSMKGRLNLKGRIVGDLRDPRRLTFMDTPAPAKKDLENLLKSYVEHQQKIMERKKTGS